MKILLDTQCWLWMQAAPRRLSAGAREWVIDRENQLFLSAASSWEIAIKHALGKLPLPVPPAEYVLSRLETRGTTPLPIHHIHALQAGALPLHHRDPFDRLLIAQAQLEGLALLTTDRKLADYDVELLWA